MFPQGFHADGSVGGPGSRAISGRGRNISQLKRRRTTAAYLEDSDDDDEGVDGDVDDSDIEEYGERKMVQGYDDDLQIVKAKSPQSSRRRNRDSEDTSHVSHRDGGVIKGKGKGSIDSSFERDRRSRHEAKSSQPSARQRVSSVASEFVKESEKDGVRGKGRPKGGGGRCLVQLSPEVARGLTRCERASKPNEECKGRDTTQGSCGRESKRQGDAKLLGHNRETERATVGTAPLGLARGVGGGRGVIGSPRGGRGGQEAAGAGLNKRRRRSLEEAQAQGEGCIRRGQKACIDVAGSNRGSADDLIVVPSQTSSRNDAPCISTRLQGLLVMSPRGRGGWRGGKGGHGRGGSSRGHTQPRQSLDQITPDRPSSPNKRSRIEDTETRTLVHLGSASRSVSVSESNSGSGSESESDSEFEIEFIGVRKDGHKKFIAEVKISLLFNIHINTSVMFGRNLDMMCEITLTLIILPLICLLCS